MEEEVHAEMDQYMVEESKRAAFRGGGAPLEWRRVCNNKFYKKEDESGEKTAEQEFSPCSEITTYSVCKASRRSQAEVSCVDWDATDGRNGGAQQTVREILIEMERFSGKAKAEDQGALALVLDLAKAYERVSLLVVWAWATHFSFPRKILRVLCGYFEHQERVQFE